MDVYRAAFLRAPEDACDFPLESIRNADIYRFLDSVEQDVPVFWLRDLICAEGICDTMLNGKFLYRDKSHLSIEGSAELGQANHWPDRIRELAR